MSGGEAAGELLTVSYSDATPDVTFKYTRLGQPESIADVLGTRSFAHNSDLLRIKETLGGSGPLSGKVITTDYGDTVSYQPQGAPYPQLFKFDRLEAVEVGTSGDPDADYRAAYDYSGDTGRMTKVTAGPRLPAGGCSIRTGPARAGRRRPFTQPLPGEARRSGAETRAAGMEVDYLGGGSKDRQVDRSTGPKVSGSEGRRVGGRAGRAE